MIDKFWKYIAKRTGQYRLTDEGAAGIFSVGSGTASGVDVTPNVAMQHSTVFACVQVISDTVASLPLLTYRRNGRAKEREPTHPVYKILHDQPNPEMTAMAFRQALTNQCLTRGNGRAYIERDNGGRVVALWPLVTDNTYLVRDDKTKKLYYSVHTKTENYKLDFENVLDVVGMTLNGILGFGPIQYAQETLGLAIATQEFGARLFSNGAQIGTVITHPGKLSKEAYEHIKESMQSTHAGLKNAHKMKLLEEGMNIASTTMPPEQAQFLETRKYQRDEICGLFRVPPHKIANLERSTNNNIEHQGLEFVTDCLQPWLIRWEQAIQMKMFLPKERQTMFAEHLVSGLLRGDVKARNESYNMAFGNGRLSANEIREMENLNPIDGGDEYYINSALVPIDKIGDFWAAKGVQNEKGSTNV